MVTDINLDKINYKMYLPNFDTDMIQKYIFNTKLPYEQSVLEYIKTLKWGGIVLI